MKNKVAPPFKEAVFDIMFGKGISRSGGILDLAVENNIVEKSGAWFAYGTEKIGQGRDKVKLYLEEHPEIMAEIEEKVRGAYGLMNSEGEAITVAWATPKENNITETVESPIGYDDDPYLAELNKKDEESA